MTHLEPPPLPLSKFNVIYADPLTGLTQNDFAEILGMTTRNLQYLEQKGKDISSVLTNISRLIKNTKSGVEESALGVGFEDAKTKRKTRLRRFKLGSIQYVKSDRRLTYDDWIKVLDWLETKQVKISPERVSELIEKLDIKWLR